MMLEATECSTGLQAVVHEAKCFPEPERCPALHSALATAQKGQPGSLLHCFPPPFQVHATKPGRNSRGCKGLFFLFFSSYFIHIFFNAAKTDLGNK